MKRNWNSYALLVPMHDSDTAVENSSSKIWTGVVAHTCNPSCPGGHRQGDCCSRPMQKARDHLKNNLKQKGLEKRLKW
jgi:hypothetical protein